MLASFAQRQWSTFFDAFALILWMLGVAFLQPWPAALAGPLKALIWFGPPLLVEPVSVWVAGRTAGQTLLRLRVMNLNDTGTRIGLFRALGRHFTKVALLGISPLYVPFSNRGQAIHDAIFRTAVVVEPLASDFRIPVAGPAHFGPFLTALVVATVSSLVLGVLLSVCIRLSPLSKSSSPFLAASADLLSSLAISTVFLSTLIRRGQKARERSAG